MDLVVEAETTALAALAAAPARHYGDATVKLATLLRRVEADDEGFLPAGEMALLRSACAISAAWGGARLPPRPEP